MVNILIANRDILYIKSLINKMNDNKSKVIKIATDEKETIEFIDCSDIAILDYNIYKHIEIELKKINERFTKSIIITSATLNFYDGLKGNSLIYYYDQNTNLEFIVKKVKELVKNKHKYDKVTNIKMKIKKETEYLKYNPLHVGTNYLIECIVLIAQSKEDLLSNLEKDVYPFIANKYHKTISNIKCNINQSTTHMYYECDSDKLKRYFNFECDMKPKPKLVMTTILNKVLR